MSIQEFLDQAGTITLCGFDRFHDAYVAANRQLTIRGWTVLSRGQFPHSFHRFAEGEDTLALRLFKILRSDAICVVQGNEYVDKLSKLEIEFARQHNRSILTFSKNTNTFKIVSQQELVFPTLNNFLSSEHWETFTRNNPHLPREE